MNTIVEVIKAICTIAILFDAIVIFCAKSSTMEEKMTYYSVLCLITILYSLIGVFLSDWGMVSASIFYTSVYAICIGLLWIKKIKKTNL